MKRQLGESEKIALLKSYRHADGFVRCFIDNEIIEDEKEIQFDHIVPFVKSEDSSLENIAPVCRKHNLAKKDMSLSEYRDKLEMEKLFEEKEQKGQEVKLNDILAFRLQANYGFPVEYSFDESNMSIELSFYKDKDKMPRQQNLLLHRGSGKSPSV